MTDTLTDSAALVDAKVVPVGAVTMDAVTAVKASVTTPLQTVVDQADAATYDLRTQRDALVAQRATLDGQINALNRQIAQTEGPGAQIARNALTAIQQAMAAPPAPNAVPPGIARMNPADRIAALRAARGLP